ncbi:MAG: FAD-binding protein [Chloroflexi bacterium]|nr:FAD-binding protein [Chloroflexota bacterium]
MMALDEFLHELQKRVSGDLRTDEYSRVLYSTDASIYQVMPQGVLIPKTVADVQAAVTLAAQYKIPLLPRTAGTSLAGQAVNAALVIDFTRHLDSILEVNVEERWVRVQPGVVLDKLNAHLQLTSLQFGPDPASGNRAAMGGIVSNNSTGSHSILYGMTADHLLEANALLNDGSSARLAPWDEAELGRVLRGIGRLSAVAQSICQLTQNPANQVILREQTPRHWRRCGGYNLDRMLGAGERGGGGAGVSYKLPPDARFNLANLICGAEGTLGVITELKLKLVPRPQMTAVVVLGFADQRAALTAVPTLLELNPSAVELLDNRQLQLCRLNAEYKRLLNSFIEGEPFCLLIVEFYGESETELQAKMNKLAAHVKGQGVAATGMTPILNPQQQKNVWQIRKGGLGLLMSLRGDAKPIPFIEDSAVPVEHLAEYVDKLSDFCSDLDTEMAVYAHASAGCLHIRPLLNTKKAEEVAKLPHIARFAVDLLKGYGGAWSSEHGDGRARSWLNEQFFGPELYGLYKQVKWIFDPDNIFNPGNVVDGRPMTEDLRFGAAYEIIPLKTELDFSSDQGFQRAIEMCNGAGACRKRETGAMCPSFMATRKEEHSTRGRANALRAALSGTLSSAELSSRRMYEVMELCVACKACQSECPSSVDMARIKTEFLAQYHKVHGVPLRDRLFAHITPISRLGSGPLAPIANASLRNGLVRRGLERLVGISAERELSPFARESFVAWCRKRPSTVNRQPSAVLFADTTTNYNYPQIGQAAVDVLAAAGCDVIVPDVHDCGRPAFSKGLVAAARKAVLNVLDVLTPHAEAGLPILFLEPSDLSMLLDDAFALLPDDSHVPLVAAYCFSFEQFIVQLIDEGGLDLRFTAETRQIILHGHCHQKALLGTAATRQVLSLPPNYSVTELDTSCCGMAGSFGYETEHVVISKRMGERRLLTAVREANAATLIVAPGISCRQQIKDGTRRQAYHPAEILYQALVDGV